MENQQAIFIDFENIALWADRDFFDFELTPLIEYLQGRGPAVVKRAYGDWGRFLRYRDELMDLSIDLIQIYSGRAGKNRADIRMAVDALETAMTRPHIKTFVIVSGDSDFGPLVARLREYGRYTLGIGPRSITHDLLVRSCDEFVYLETIMGEAPDEDVSASGEREAARTVMLKALHAHGQRGELPVLAAKLKQTMLLMDPAFNEANFGYAQFKNWLEEHQDLISLYLKDLQLYVAPADFTVPGSLGLSPLEPVVEVQEAPERTPSLEAQYRQMFTRMRMTTSDFSTRRDVLRDIYRELREPNGLVTTDELLENLRDRYDALNLGRSKPVLRDILQTAFRQKAFDYGEKSASLYVPVRLASGIDSEADFVRRAESDFVYSVVRSGLELDLAVLANIMLGDRSQVEYVQTLLDDLDHRSVIARKGKRYGLPGRDTIPFRSEPALKILCRDIDSVKLPEGKEQGVAAARNIARSAMLQRSQDFVASASNYLLACRLLWDAVERNETGATLQDLRWYMASYASANAGKYSQVYRDYTAARPYYLAFFALVREDDPLWSRMRGLINPMLSYYWANAGREMNINTSAWNLSGASPAQIAVSVATYPDSELHRRWQALTEDLARINPDLLRRIADQLTLDRGESPEYAQVADQIKHILDDFVEE
jgi:uncharacterized LabA/DUF88 family protein